MKIGEKMSETFRDLLMFCMSLLGLLTVLIAANPNETMAGWTLVTGAAILTLLHKL